MRKGFGLLEVLIIISVIAILVAICVDKLWLHRPKSKDDLPAVASDSRPVREIGIWRIETLGCRLYRTDKEEHGAVLISPSGRREFITEEEFKLDDTKARYVSYGTAGGWSTNVYDPSHLEELKK